MTQWVIYDHPLDYPDHYVVRRWKVLENGELVPDQDCFLAKTLEDARSLVPRGFWWFGRCTNDDPAILEVWI